MKSKSVRQTISGTNLEDAIIIQNWLSYAKELGDISYKEITTDIVEAKWLVDLYRSRELALSNSKGPSVIALTRQKLPMIRKKYLAKNISAQGAYELKSNSKNPDISIFASGSEVEIGLQLMSILEKKKKLVRVVSLPCMEQIKIQNKT